MSAGVPSEPYTFTKMQAVGNDFVVLEPTNWPEDSDWNAIAVQLCDRHFGVGGDGLLLVLPSEVADIRMRMFNPDGTEDMCGNGLRCVIHYAANRGLLKGNEGIAEAQDGLHAFRLNDGQDASKPAGSISVQMSAPRFAPADIPMLTATSGASCVIDSPLSVDGYGTISVSSVNTGSTHTVLWVDALPQDETFFDLSPRIENHPAFPERTSVLWAVVEESKSCCSDIVPRLQLRIWERGAGETLGCGTGACAAAVLAAAQKKIEAQPSVLSSLSYLCQIASKGGTLLTSFPLLGSDHIGNVELTGVAQTVYQGSWHGETR